MNNSSIYGSIHGESAPFTLESRDILLREFVPEDLDDFCAVTAEPHIREFLPDWHVDKETRRIWLRDYEIPGSREFLEAAAQGGQVEDRMLRLAVIARSSGRFVGWCCTGIKDELPRPNREIVYGLSAASCGRGYMTQAVTLLADWLFAHTDIRLINGLARPNNVASNRVLQKCGFERLGELMLENGRFLHYALERKADRNPERKPMPDKTEQPDIANENKSAQLPHSGELCLQTATENDAEDLRALMIEIETDGTEDPLQSEESCRAFGQSAAALHEAMDRLSSGTGADSANGKPLPPRAPADMDALLRRPLRIILDYIGEDHPEAPFLRRYAQGLETAAAEAAANGLDFGLCHGDMHGNNNALRQADRFAHFDFEFAAPGWRAWDLAQVKNRKRQSAERIEPLWQAFLEGYRSIRPFAEADEAAVGTFMLVRRFWTMGLDAELAPMWDGALDFGEDWLAGFLEEFRRNEVGQSAAVIPEA
ncbi:GNAT family N-acetyltransferase [Saccharibacillus deserti]|uniref:GNAT family N-acetyltransferase n=1 Tax=Saccharibacillus deserti TaxID=1634444 RepID=UPI001FEB5DC0|nr:GNAT family N-acetyltransferase [Saccharibacillus deserti]